MARKSKHHSSREQPAQAVVPERKAGPEKTMADPKPEPAEIDPTDATPEPTNPRPPDYWRCEWCGHINELKATACAQCTTAKSPVHPE